MPNVGNKLTMLCGFSGLCLIGFVCSSPHENINLSSVSSAQTDDSAFRQRCYGAGIMHGDDTTDPQVLGISEGICRQSYEAGRAYFQHMQQQSNDALKQLDGIMQSSCQDGKRMIEAAKQQGEYDEAKHLQSLMPSECK